MVDLLFEGCARVEGRGTQGGAGRSGGCYLFIFMGIRESRKGVGYIFGRSRYDKVGRMRLKESDSDSDK